MNATCRPATRDDGEAIARIYNHYVAGTTVTFEEGAVAGVEMATRLDEISRAGLPFLVAASDDELVGFAHASPWKGRCAYRHTAEVSVYLDPALVGRGLGSALYAALFPLLEDRKLHAVIAGIALPNDGSIALHEKFGLRKVAHFAEVGFKFGRWVDVGYWQRVFTGPRA
ncbi:MAG TPA: GNAT family N-acetyltransferase [Vicinamibacterales bacterium]|nr:GNAT family N-acetyltransferase [Vicinamibacterales bacterium]